MGSLFVFNASTKLFYKKYPMLLAGFLSFNALADCGANGGEITSATSIACTVTTDNSTVTVSSDMNAQISLQNDNGKVIVNNGGVISSSDPNGVLQFISPNTGSTAWEITNNGSILNTAPKDSSHQGVFVSGGNGSLAINNNGKISANDSSVWVMGFSGDVAINNSETGTIESESYAIDTYGSSDTELTVDNKGTIKASGATGYAIGGDAKTTIRNSGTISANAYAVQTGSKNDTLILDTTSVITGKVDLGGGDDELQLVGASGTGTISDLSTYSNIEKLTKDEDGTWVLKGTSNDFTAGTTVKAGSLLLDTDSKLTSNVTVNSGSTFGGYGEVVGNVDNSGTIAVANAAPGFSDGGMSTFTVDGNYTGNNGDLVMNMALGDDSSSGSKFVVTGDTAGTTNVTINNAGGMGGETVEGIEVIEVDGKSDGVFTQKGRIVAGAYDYTLVKGNSTSDKNWYLTSELSPEGDDGGDGKDNSDNNGSGGDNGNSDDGSHAGNRPVRPEVGGYMSNQAMAKSMFIGTMHDRVGEQGLIQSMQSDSLMPSTWLRTSGSHTKSNSAGNIDNDTDTTMFQLGNDLTSWSSTGSDRFHVGFIFGYGDAKTDSYSSRSLAGSQNSTSKTSGYNVGLYGTWYADAKNMNGLYVDSSLQYSWFNNEIKGEQLAAEKYDSNLWQASVETGYSFLAMQQTDNSLYIEPQAQVIYSALNSDDFHEQNGTLVHDADNNSFTTRLGARVYDRISADGMILQPFVEMNWWHDTDNGSITMNVDKFYNDMPKDRYEAKAGVEGKINGKLSSWVNMGYQSGENDFSQLTGMIGAKYIW